MPCDHDKRCKVCTCCQQCYPHAISYWDDSGLQGGCRDAGIRRQLEDYEALERAAGLDSRQGTGGRKCRQRARGS